MSGFGIEQSLLDSQEYAAASQYLEAPTSSLDDALDAFCRRVEEQIATKNASEIESDLRQLWKVIIALAASSSGDNTRQTLADFMLGIAQRPALQSDGQTCKLHEMTVWKDLPIFGWQLREAWNNAASDNDSSTIRQQWINLNAFTAVLVATAHAKTNDEPDESLYCIWSVRSALEETQQPSNAALSAAAVWLINAAPAIHDFSGRNKQFDGKVAKPGSLFKDEEWRGFSEQRIRSWGQRLSELQGNVEEERTAELVKRARKAMGEIKER